MCNQELKITHESVVNRLFPEILRAVAKLVVQVKGEEIKFPPSAEEETFIKTGYVIKKKKNQNDLS